MFKEKSRGAISERRQLAQLLEKLDRRDLLLVTRPDRLARSTRDLLEILAGLAEKKVGFHDAVASPAVLTEATTKAGYPSKVAQ